MPAGAGTHVHEQVFSLEFERRRNELARLDPGLNRHKSISSQDRPRDGPRVVILGCVVVPVGVSHDSVVQPGLSAAKSHARHHVGAALVPIARFAQVDEGATIGTNPVDAVATEGKLNVERSIVFVPDVRPPEALGSFVRVVVVRGWEHQIHVVRVREFGNGVGVQVHGGEERWIEPAVVLRVVAEHLPCLFPPVQNVVKLNPSNLTPAVPDAYVGHVPADARIVEAYVACVAASEDGLVAQEAKMHTVCGRGHVGSGLLVALFPVGANQFEALILRNPRARVQENRAGFELGLLERKNDVRLFVPLEGNSTQRGLFPMHTVLGRSQTKPAATVAGNGVVVHAQLAVDLEKRVVGTHAVRLPGLVGHDATLMG